MTESSGALRAPFCQLLSWWVVVKPHGVVVMAGRKTIAVSELVGRVNAIIAATSDDMRESRITLGVLLDSVLVETANYKGFRYLPSELDADGQLRDGYDGTRKRYIVGE